MYHAYAAGKIKPWNKGLTVEDDRVRRNIEAATATRRAGGGWTAWNKGLSAKNDERVRRHVVALRDWWDKHNPLFLPRGGRGPNKFESFIGSLHPALRFVGDGSLWIRLPGGRNKNPDFVIEPFIRTKTVLEAADIAYWHTREEMEEVQSLYEQIGWQCILAYYQDWKSNSQQFQERLLAAIERVE
jgi:hypothetical protein